MSDFNIRNINYSIFHILIFQKGSFFIVTPKLIWFLNSWAKRKEEKRGENNNKTNKKENKNNNKTDYVKLYKSYFGCTRPSLLAHLCATLIDLKGHYLSLIMP